MVSSACFPSSAILWSHRQQFFGQIAHCAVATRWQAEAPSSSPFNLQSNNTNCGWRYEVENGAFGDGRLRWWMCLRVPVLCFVRWFKYLVFVTNILARDRQTSRANPQIILCARYIVEMHTKCTRTHYSTMWKIAKMEYVVPSFDLPTSKIVTDSVQLRSSCTGG